MAALILDPVQPPPDFSCGNGSANSGHDATGLSNQLAFNFVEPKTLTMATIGQQYRIYRGQPIQAMP